MSITVLLPDAADRFSLRFLVHESDELNWMGQVSCNSKLKVELKSQSVGMATVASSLLRK